MPETPRVRSPTGAAWAVAAGRQTAAVPAAVAAPSPRSTDRRDAVRAGTDGTERKDERECFEKTFMISTGPTGPRVPVSRVTSPSRHRGGGRRPARGAHRQEGRKAWPGRGRARSLTI
ncbi:hypothetical protein GCM10010222_49380 [Streptomyces tanashiensis]|nr:hypothetical protein GCM10010222_49380 [Streptomyces tanashiensis]